MSAADVQLVTGLYDAYRRGDYDAIRPHLAPDVVIEQPSVLPWADRRHGPDGFFAFFQTLFTHVESELQIEAIFDAGDTVVQSGRTVGKVLANGAPFDAREVHVLTVRDGKLVHLQVYVDVEQMLAAVNGATSRPVGA